MATNRQQSQRIETARAEVMASDPCKWGEVFSVVNPDNPRETLFGDEAPRERAYGIRNVIDRSASVTTHSADDETRARNVALMAGRVAMGLPALGYDD